MKKENKITLILIILFILGAIADTFTAFLNKFTSEVNPFVMGFLTPLMSAIILKVLMIGIVLYIVYKKKPHTEARWFVIMMLIIYAIIFQFFGAWTNLNVLDNTIQQAESQGITVQEYRETIPERTQQEKAEIYFLVEFVLMGLPIILSLVSFKLWQHTRGVFVKNATK